MERRSIASCMGPKAAPVNPNWQKGQRDEFRLHPAGIFCDNNGMLGFRLLFVPGLLCGFASRLWGGGSGLNTLIVVNQNSSNSVQLGNYYAERRHVPPQNFLRINWSGGHLDWTNTAHFKTYLVDPLLSTLANRQLTNQVEYVVLSMDIPYQVLSDDNTTYNSTTAALFYGFKTNGPAPGPGLPDSCSLPAGSSNSYAGSEGIFRAT